MNCNLPPLRVFVDLKFITSNFIGSAKCHLISVRTLQNQAMQFSVLLEDGTLYTGLPLNALSWESVPTSKSLKYCQPWDCISSSSQVICFDTLRYMPVQVTPIDEKGIYLFTIDFLGNSDLSRNSEHWKQMHVVALDSGHIVAYPQYNLKFLDAGMCSPSINTHIKTFESLLNLAKKMTFYADNKSYRSKNGGHIENKNFHSPIGQDCGRKATQALKDLKNLYPKYNCPKCNDWFHMPYKFCSCPKE